MICPVCKAQNHQGPLCRRCRADLAPLFLIEAHQERLLCEARLECGQGRWSAAMGFADVAAELENDEKSRRFLAVLSLLRRDFPGAWQAYQRYRAMNRS
jgi:hypothetical protein